MTSRLYQVSGGFPRIIRSYTEEHNKHASLITTRSSFKLVTNWLTNKNRDFENNLKCAHVR